MRTFSIVFLAAICLGVAMRAPASASYVPAGSYNDSCVDIQAGGNVLTASCQDIDGHWHPAQANIAACPSRSFVNNDGTLVCGIGGYRFTGYLPRGSWRVSCNDASESGSILNASCYSPSRQWISTSLDIRNCPSRVVDNVDGNLVCGGGLSNGWERFQPGYSPNTWPNNPQYAGPYPLPAGNWKASCRNFSMQGPVLYAQCSDGNGAWVQASFNVSQFPNAFLQNNHGVLVNERGPIYRYPQ
jgi:hypothetical protein